MKQMELGKLVGMDKLYRRTSLQSGTLLLRNIKLLFSWLVANFIEDIQSVDVDRFEVICKDLAVAFCQ